MTPHEWALVAASAAAAVPAALRWLRVAQREHYLAGSATRFELRWARSTIFDMVAVASAIAAAAAAAAVAAIGWWTLAVVAAWPPRLGVRGRSSPLAWTKRLRRLTAATAVLWVAIAATGSAAGAPVPAAAVGTLLVPQLVDVASAAVAPVERRLGRRFVERAAAALRRIGPTIVAVTGSYGKTTTKVYVRHLLGPAAPVVASPASFNNRMGLARAVNEHLSPGTKVFVAEMGTYGPGEIADLCRWIPPDVAVITAIGPVHLERFGSLETTARSKAEVLADAPIAVVNGDTPLLDPHVAASGAGRIIRCSVRDESADVAAIEDDGHLRVLVGGSQIARFEAAGVFPMNVACAVGAAMAAGGDLEEIAGRLHDLPEVEHRARPAVGASGITVIDDTYNANPAGGRAAVDRLAGLGAGTSVLVTPGMVELGPVQASENRAFAEYAADRVDHILIVGRTNRRALASGAAAGWASVVFVHTRDEAVAWVRAHLAAGDAVLYENDLPDHHP